MCTFREISSSTLFVVLFDELLGNVTASKKLHAKYCVVWSVHAGTSPPFMQTRATFRHLRAEVSERGGQLLELVTFREPNAYALSFFNYVCLVQCVCGANHSHTPEEFARATPNLQTKYLLVGHAVGWRTRHRCPEFFNGHNCTVDSSKCASVQVALEDVWLVRSEDLFRVVHDVLSNVFQGAASLELEHENHFPMDPNVAPPLVASPDLTYPDSWCDSAIYARSFTTTTVLEPYVSGHG